MTKNLRKIPNGNGHLITFITHEISIVQGVLINNTLYLQEKDPIHLTENCIQSVLSEGETPDAIAEILKHDSNKTWYTHNYVPILVRKNKIITGIVEGKMYKGSKVFSAMQKEEHRIIENYLLEEEEKKITIHDTEVYFDNKTGSDIYEHSHQNCIIFSREKRNIRRIYFTIHTDTIKFHNDIPDLYPEIFSLDFGSQYIHDSKKTKLIFPKTFLKALCNHIGLSEHETITVLHEWKQKSVNILPVLRECLMMQEFQRSVISRLKNNSENKQ